jgi:hypothetical protein
MLLGLLPQLACADLYRWVDPETGSVKFSSYPPPWYGDPEQEKRAPQVERIPERMPAAASGPATAPGGAAPGNTMSALEERLKRVLQQLNVLPTQADFQRSGSGLKQHLDAYAAVVAEMDRLDPAGAARRRAESQPLLDRLIQGLRAQFATKPPAPPGAPK